MYLLAYRSLFFCFFFFFSSRRRHTRCLSDWSSDVCSSDLGDEGPSQPQVRAALKFLRCVVDVVNVQHADPLEAVGGGLTEIGDPVVVGSAESGEEFTVGKAIPEEALTRLQAGGPHAVGFQFFEHGVGLVGAVPDIFPEAETVDRRRIFEPLTGLHHASDGANPRAPEVPGVVLTPHARAMPFHAGRTAAEFRLNARVVQIGGLYDVRIGRDQLVPGHDEPPESWGIGRPFRFYAVAISRSSGRMTSAAARASCRYCLALALGNSWEKISRRLPSGSKK